LQNQDKNNRLDRILASVRSELEQRKRQVPVAVLEQRASLRGDFRKIRHRIGKPPGVIAEIKRASPSRGTIRTDLDAGQYARMYEDAGASAVSVLTETRHFGGSLSDLEAASSATLEAPILRKDFLLDEYMLVESRAHGADLVLLIVAVLGEDTRSMVRLAEGCGLDPLVEVHDERELEIALDSGAGIVGVNNRDLATFSVDLGTAERLLPRIPAGTIRVVESGIRFPSELRRLAGMGADLFLIGETLVRSEDPARLIREFLSEGISKDINKEGEEWKRKSS